MSEQIYPLYLEIPPEFVESAIERIEQALICLEEKNFDIAFEEMRKAQIELMACYQEAMTQSVKEE